MVPGAAVPNRAFTVTLSRRRYEPQVGRTGRADTPGHRKIHSCVHRDGCHSQFSLRPSVVRVAPGVVARPGDGGQLVPPGIAVRHTVEGRRIVAAGLGRIPVLPQFRLPAQTPGPLRPKATAGRRISRRSRPRHHRHRAHRPTATLPRRAGVRVHHRGRGRHARPVAALIERFAGLGPAWQPGPGLDGHRRYEGRHRRTGLGVAFRGRRPSAPAAPATSRSTS
jgi:hypothetical protein